MTDLTDLTLEDARKGLDDREFSARDLTNAYLGAVEAARSLNAFITETPDEALKMAELADAALAEGEGKALTGIPIAVKDLFCTKGVLTTAASRILGNFKPTYE
jgi:aspartyl-tRNA(Asn)/glutamyl-tRNA(Gln) amidotransferase subunit A